MNQKMYIKLEKPLETIIIPIDLPQDFSDALKNGYVITGISIEDW